MGKKLSKVTLESFFQFFTIGKSEKYKRFGSGLVKVLNHIEMLRHDF